MTVTGRDRTIQDLQKRIDQLKSELEGERKAAGMERQETARCRQEYSALSNSVWDGGVVDVVDVGCGSVGC